MSGPEQDAAWLDGNMVGMAKVNGAARGGIMGNRTDHPREDYLDLDFDLEPHREAIRVMASSGLSPETIRAGLKARDLIHVRVRSGPFGIGLTGDLRKEESQAKERWTAREVIYQSRDLAAAQQVRSDVESYFRRHFPGRCVASPPKSGTLAAAGEKFVYVVLFEPLS